MSEINYTSAEENVVNPYNTPTTVDHSGYIPTKTTTDIHYTYTGTDTSRVSKEQKTTQPLMSFGSMLNSLICDGVRASRSSWHRYEHINVRVPDEHHRMGCPYIYIIRTRFGKPVPWLPSFEDIFAKDWVVFK